MEQTAPRVRESPVRPQKPGQARCADVIGADLLRSGRVLQRSKTPFDSPMARASKRILRFLQRRAVITLVTAPGDGEVTVVADEIMGEKDPLLARLLAAATAGAAPAGPANKRKVIRIVHDPARRHHAGDGAG